jgi:hypothetical protein
VVSVVSDAKVAFIFYAILVLGGVALVGHLIWISVAAVFRAIAGAGEPQSKSRRDVPKECPACGRPLSQWLPRCAGCGMDPMSPAAVEFGNLATTMRQLTVLAQTGDLDQATFDRIRQSVEERRRTLRAPEQAPIAQPAPAATPPSPAPLWQLLEQFLMESCADVRAISARDRDRAVEWYLALPEERRAGLPAMAQLNMARLLRLSGMRDEPLRVYRRFLERYPQNPAFAVAAFEAGRFAIEQKLPKEAEWFLSRALSGSLPPDDRQAAKRLLAGLVPAAIDSIPEVIPVVESAPEMMHEPAAGEPPVLEIIPLQDGAPELAHQAADLTSSPESIPIRESTPVKEEHPVPEFLQRIPPPPPARRAKPPRPPKPPRRSLAEMMAAFMEERNIFWGELVGGLLMVGSSIALVIYLWKEIQQIKYYEFLIFVSTTAAVFGAGIYSFYRLKLATTGRGLLGIATLLVPLNFLVMANLHRGEAELGFRVASEILSLAIFAGLMIPATRALVPEGRGWLIVAVLVLSASLLAVPRFLPDPMQFSFSSTSDLVRLLLLGCLAVLSHGVCATAVIAGLGRREQFEESHAAGLLAFLGLMTFPLLAALGFLAYWSHDIGLALESLSPLIALAGMPILAGGLLIQRRLSGGLGAPARQPEPAEVEGQSSAGSTGASSRAAALRTAGTAVTVAGILFMLTATALAWPQPVALMLVCTLDFAVLTAVAFLFSLPIAHAAALPCLAAGYLTAFHYFAGHLTVSHDQLGAKLLEMVLSAQSGSVLVFLVLMMAVAAEFLVRAGRRVHGLAYAIGSGLVGVLSFGLVNLHGIEDPATAAVITGVYAAGGLAMNLRYRRPAISYLALALTVASTLWGLWWQQGALTPTWALVLAIESAVMAAVAVLVPWRALFPDAWRDVSSIVAAAAVFTGLWVAPEFHWLWPHTIPLAITAFLLAWAYHAAPLTWAGSAFVLAALLHAQDWKFAVENTRFPVLIALLAHATVVLLASLGLTAYLRRDTRESARSSRDLLDRVFAKPLYQSALVSSLAGLPLVLVLAWPEMLELSVYMGWLSLVWLLIACTARSPLLFTLFQTGVTATAFFGATAWLQGHEWAAGGFPELLENPDVLRTYCIAMAGVGLVWLLVRFAVRKNAPAQKLLNPAWPQVDWVVLALVLMGHVALSVWMVLPGIEAELTPHAELSSVAQVIHAVSYHGPSPWVLAALLGIVLTASLWSRQQAEATFGLVLLAVTVPTLIAPAYRDEIATASALRWGFGICLLVCSLLVWLREPLTGFAAKVGCPFEPARRVSAYSRRLLITCTVVPLLALTVATSWGFFGESTPIGPLTGSIFARIGPTNSHAIPLMVAALAFVGYALRERSAGYAFAGGILVNLGITGGYALAVAVAGRETQISEWVRLIQLATITAAVWALAWLESRRWVAAWRELPDAPLAGPLMSLQLGMSSAGNAVLLVPALWFLVATSPGTSTWTSATGSLIGWLAFLSSGAAWIRRMTQLESRASPLLLGLLTMAVLGLIACTVDGWQPGWSYRVLMLGWASYMPVLVLAGFLWRDSGARLAKEEDENTSSSHRLALLLSRSLAPDVVAFWVCSAGVLVIALGLKAAIVSHDHLWAAAAIFVAGVAGAAMAVWRRREEWAFISGLAVNLAASLVVWHIHLQSPAVDWWVYLLQANVIAASVVAFLWLGARRLLRPASQDALPQGETSRDTSASTSRDALVPGGPLLALQIALGFGGAVVLLVSPLAWMIIQPGERLPGHLAPVGYLTGWLAFLLATAATIAYADQVERRSRAHFLVIGALGLGILAACTSANSAAAGDWLAFHILLATWTGIGLAVMAAEPIAKMKDGALADFSSLPFLAGFLDFTVGQLRAWLRIVGSLVFLLAIRGAWQDPERPYWSAGATLAVSIMVALLAVRTGVPANIYVSGLLVNVTGAMVWLAWGPGTLLSLTYTQVLCFGFASGCWAAVELWFRVQQPAVDLRGRLAPFTHVWLLAGLCVLVVLVAASVGSDIFSLDIYEGGLLAWTATAAITVALVLTLWDKDARFTFAGLYAAGLLALGLMLHTLQLEPRWLGWWAGTTLAAYILLAAGLGLVAPQLSWIWRDLHLPSERRWPEAWLSPVQTLLAVVVLGLSLWICLTFDTVAERLAGPGAVLLLMPAGIALTQYVSGRWGRDLRYATLVAGVCACIEGGWALLDVTGPLSWLYRNLLFMVSLALMTVIYGVGLGKILPHPSAWAVCGRRMGPVLGSLAMLMLLVVLGHEALLYPQIQSTPIDPVAVAAVVVALVGLITAGIYFAVVPGRDPFGLSERGRTLYVYAGEVLLVLLFVHLKLTVPWIFHHQLEAYWPFIVMAIAFVGVGLGDFFARSGLRVLAEPLQRTGVFLPLLPLIAFWIRPTAGINEFAARQFPAVQSIVEHLQRIEPDYGKYSLLWFMLGVLYTIVARSKRSPYYALFAALASNAGIWALLYQHNDKVGFLVHPQLWLIPLALVILVAEHLNRAALSAAQSGALRYAGLLMIYVSSTADMFIARLDNVLFPMVLAGLSVLGVLSGMLLRVRAFIYLGVTFLFVVILAMIWHAAVELQHVWVWWVSGIVLGAAIIILFAIFENRRNDIMRAINELKKWE